MSEVAQTFLKRWHEIVAARDKTALPEVISEQACFRSPFFFAPQHGRDYMATVLSTVMDVLHDFEYHREFVDGQNLALEFSATVGDLSVKGIDLIALDDEGLIAELEVFLRPMNGLQAAGKEMMRRLTGGD